MSYSMVMEVGAPRLGALAKAMTMAVAMAIAPVRVEHIRNI